MPTPVALWHASDSLCSCCAKPVPAIGMEASKGARATVEHVFPRSPGGKAMAKIRVFYDLFPGMFKNRRTAIAHSKCNNRKGNRAPTGCEVVFLMAVNARLYDRKPAPTAVYGRESTSADRTAARKARRAHSKERKAQLTAEMQAALNPIERLRALPGALLVVTRDG
jgi:hypothetical protein